MNKKKENKEEKIIIKVVFFLIGIVVALISIWISKESNNINIRENSNIKEEEIKKSKYWEMGRKRTYNERLKEIKNFSQEDLNLYYEVNPQDRPNNFSSWGDLNLNP